MATKQLILLRHAKSDWESGARSDHDRPLNQRGRRDAPVVGQWLAENGYTPQCVLCSSALRTRETLDLAMQGAGWQDSDLNIDYDSDLYLASENTIVEKIKTGLVDYSGVMVVAHNPGMDMVLHYFCPDVEVDDNRKLMTTAAVAIIEFNEADLNTPKLLAFKRPKDLS